MMRKLLYSFLFFITSKSFSKKTFTPSLGLLCVGMFFLCLSSAYSQILQRGTYVSNTTGGTTLTIGKPTGLAVGDIMLAQIVQVGYSAMGDAVNNNWNVIAGSNIRGTFLNHCRATLFYKIATNADVVASNFSFSLNGNSTDGEGAIIAFSGVNTSNPFDIMPGTVYTNVNSGRSLNATAITTTTSDAAVIMFSALQNNVNISNWSTGAPGNLTLNEIYDLPVDTGMGAAWAVKANAGSTGGGNAVISGNSNVYNGSILIALRRAVPTITNVGTSGCVGGNITISGTNLTGATAANVRIGGTPVSSIISSSSTQIVAVIGNGTTGTVTVNNGIGTATSTQTFTVNQLPTASNAGPDQYSSSAFTLAANTPTQGTGLWTITSGPNASTTQFSSLSSPTATFTPLAAGTYALNWTISNSCDTSTDQVIVSNCVGNLIVNGDFSSNGSNWTPAASLGNTVEINEETTYFSTGRNDKTAELDSEASLSQTVTVVPNVPYTLSFLYARRIGAPATVAVNVKITGGSFSTSTSYTATNEGVPLTASFPFTPTSSSITIEFYNPQNPGATFGSIIDNIVLVPSSQVTPIATTSPKGTFKTLKACANVPIQLDVANVSIPGVTYAWSSPSGAVFSPSANIKNPTVTFTGTGAREATVVVTTPGGCSGIPSTTYFDIVAPPTVYNVTGGSSCSNGSGITVGLANSTSGVNYQLQLDGVNNGGVFPGNTGSPISFGNKTAVGTYTVVATSSTISSCSLNMNGSAVIYPAATLSLTSAAGTSSQTVCAGTAITNIVYAYGGGATGVSLAGLPLGLNSVVNATVRTLTISGTPTTGGTFKVTTTGQTSSCATVELGGTITVNPNLTASVSIGASTPTTICAGTSVTFTATPTNPGTAPTYQWRLNGGNVGSDSTTYTTSGLANGDVVSCVMTSNATPCLTGSTATSNNITITVDPNKPASVSIAASTPTTICAGRSVTFTATPVNGGSAPTYQWYNGSSLISGVSGATYTSTTLTNGSDISVVMTSNDSPCVTGSPAASNIVKMTVQPLAGKPSVGTVKYVSCSGNGSVILGNLPSTGSFEINQINQSGQILNTTPVASSTGTYEVTGLTTGTYYFTVQSTTSCMSAQSNAVDIKDDSSTTWTGSGWSNGPPSATKNVIIASAAGNPFAADIEACKLTITVPNGLNDPAVKVPDGVTLTITNEVTSNGKLLFESGSSLIQNTDAVNSGEIIYQRKTSVRRYDLTYWSMPVTNADFTMYTLSPLTLADKYFYLDTSIGDWATYYGGKKPMVPGIAYNIRAPQTFDITEKADFTAQFIGIPNNGNIPTNVAAGGWNLIGNPYPSAIDAEEFRGDNPGIGPLYFWAHVNLPVNTGVDKYYYYMDDFIAYNGLGSNGDFDGSIAAAQGFLVQPIAGIINFNNSQRIKGNNKQFFKTAKSSVEKHRIWINFGDKSGSSRRILVGYAQGATNTTDTEFDAMSMDSDGLIDFYSINNSRKLVIQGRALPFVKSDLVPFGYMVNAKGDYTISIDHADGIFNENQEVFLEDKTTGKITNLRLANYTFNSNAGTFNSRFVLRYTNSTLGTDDFESLENSVLVSVKNRVIKIASSKESIKDINIFNVGAQLLYSKNNVNSSEFEISNLQSSDQALLVKITLENGHTFTKKIIFSNL